MILFICFIYHESDHLLKFVNYLRINTLLIVCQSTEYLMSWVRLIQKLSVVSVLKCEKNYKITRIYFSTNAKLKIIKNEKATVSYGLATVPILGTVVELQTFYAHYAPSSIYVLQFSFWFNLLHFAFKFNAIHKSMRSFGYNIWSLS